MISKKEVLENIEEVRKYVAEIDSKKDETKVKIQIKTLGGSILFESEKSTIKEAVEDAVEQDADLRDADLRDADLIDADLRDADLRDAYLRDADLRSADLRDADLGCAYLGGAYLGGADLRSADLGGADFYQTKFFGRRGNTRIKKNQIDDFFTALGIVVED